MYSFREQRVLVTGAAGFLGANLVRTLLEQRAQVHALTRPSTDLWRLTEVLPRLTIHRVDLTDFQTVQSVVDAVGPDVVFHLASLAGHLTSWPEREEGLRVNVLGTAFLLEALSRTGVQWVVHVGSSTEYGAKSVPLRETDRLEPTTARGVAKAAATLICQQWARVHGRPVIVLRPFSIFGPWESPIRLIPTAIRAAFRGEEVHVTFPGSWHDFVYVDDVVEACLLAPACEKSAGEIINVGSGRQWANEEVVELVQSVCGRTISVRVGAYTGHPTDTGHWVADNEKARRLLQWTPRHSLQEGLAKTVPWLARHLNLYDAWLERHPRAHAPRASTW